MLLPSFGNIGKPFRDLFKKYYEFTRINFDFKSKTEENVDLHIHCAEEKSKMLASADVTFKPVDGVSVKTKIDSKNQIANEIEIKNDSLSTQHNIVTTIDQHLGNKRLTLKNSLKKDRINAEVEMDFTSKYPITTASFVVGDKGYLAGAQAVVDTHGFDLTEHVYSVGYVGKDFEMHGSLTNHQQIAWKLLQTYQRVSVGCFFQFTRGFSDVKFGIASMYKVNDDTFIKGRISEYPQLGFAYGFKPTPETQVIVAMETSLDTNNSSSRNGLTVEISN